MVYAKLTLSARFLLTFVGVILVAGCATSYQSSGLSGGYSETMLAPDMVRIVFRGNGFTRSERAQDLALLRAAELSLQSGYPFFAVLSETNDSSSQAITTPGTSYTTGSAHVTGQQVHYSGQTTHVPGQTIMIRRPENGILVQFLKAKPPQGFVYDAEFLRRTLGGKYGRH